MRVLAEIGKPFSPATYLYATEGSLVPAMASWRSRLVPRYTVYWSEPAKMPASRPGKFTSSRAPSVFTWQPADWYFAQYQIFMVLGHSCQSGKSSQDAFLNDFGHSRPQCGCAPRGYIPAWIPAFQNPPNPVKWERYPANACLPLHPSPADWEMPAKSCQTVRDCNRRGRCRSPADKASRIPTRQWSASITLRNAQSDPEARCAGCGKGRAAGIPAIPSVPRDRRAAHGSAPSYRQLNRRTRIPAQCPGARGLAH